jgi:S-DNA-T family DNA segregation ATPase FtsK/SpoIIIE
MSRKDKKENKKDKRKNDEDGDTSGSYLQEETLRAIIAVLFFVLGVFLTLSSGPIGKGGSVGRGAYALFHYLFGIGYYLLPVVFFILCVSFFRSLHKKLAITHSIGGLLFFISSLALTNIALVGRGGLLGDYVSAPLISLFDTPVSTVILLAFVVISLLIIFDAPLRFDFLTSLFRKKEILPGTEDQGPELLITNAAELGLTAKDLQPAPALSLAQAKRPPEEQKKSNDFGMSPLLLSGREFVPPPLSLLQEDRGKPGVGDIKANSNIIKRTLANFGINVEMDEISIGPSITRYALKPAEGVKLSRIVGLQNDLALALAAHPIRIEAPIPGKSLVGIEIPNSTKTTVGLGTLLATLEFQESLIHL